MESKRSCTPWPKSRVSVVDIPTWSARKPMSTWTSGKSYQRRAGFPRTEGCHCTDPSLSVLGRSLPKSSSASLPSSRTLPSTRFPHGSSIANATLWTAKTRRCWPTAWIASYVKIWSVWRRSGRIVVYGIIGVCVWGDNTQKRLAGGVGPLVCPRRRVELDEHGPFGVLGRLSAEMVGPCLLLLCIWDWRWCANRDNLKPKVPTAFTGFGTHSGSDTR